MHVMVVPSWYSSKENPVHGSFFKEQFKALQDSQVKVSVAYNEIWPITQLKKHIFDTKKISFTIEDGLNTYRYKNFNFLPKNKNMFKIFNKRMEKLYLEIVNKEGKVDIIHAHSAFFGGISACYVAKKYNIPFVLTEHSSLKYAKYVKKSYIEYIIDTYNKADKLIAVGNGLKEEMENYTKNPIVVINNIIDFSVFNDNFVSSTWKNDTINLFSLSYLVEEKGMDRLIEAFNEAFKGKNIRLTIGGDGPLKPKLEEMTRKYNLENQVKFLGALSRQEVAREMGKCDGFVLASEHETFGVVYVEALSMGKPILGTENGGASDIINNRNGIIVKNKDHNALVKGLKDFTKSLNTFDKKLIREECLKNYSAEVIVNKIKEIYKQICK